MKEIPLTHGAVALVDDADYELLSQWRWHVSTNGYARAMIKDAGAFRGVYMHRLIMGMAKEDKRQIDHVDRQKTNNQRSNLRICTHRQNHYNIGVRRDNAVGLKGVSWSASNRKWVSSIKVDGEQKWLGSFETPEQAHAAYRSAAVEYHGEFVNLSNVVGGSK